MFKFTFILLVTLITTGCRTDQEVFTDANTSQSSNDKLINLADLPLASTLQCYDCNNVHTSIIVYDEKNQEPSTVLVTEETSSKLLEKLGSTTLAPHHDEAKAIVSDELYEESSTNISIVTEEEENQEQDTELAIVEPLTDSNISITIDDEDNNNTESIDNNTTILYDGINPELEPYYYQQWYLDLNKTFYDLYNIDTNASINAGEVLKYYGGESVKIAIIDDGLDVTHEEFNNSIVQTYDISTKGTNVSHNSSYGYHGTAVTGVIAANANAKGIMGIAHKAKIIFLKHKVGMSDSETIELFQKAEAFGADIINCSWGTYDVSQSVKETIQNLANNGRDGKGIIVVFAVGNDNQDMRNDESAIPEVIAVGATDKDNLRAWYSNFGQYLDIMAPGGYEIGITTLDNMRDNGVSSEDENYLLYDDDSSFIGTSASAPIVTGVIALLLEANPHLTRIEVTNILKESSDKIGNVEYIDGWNKYYGYGKINLTKVMQNTSTTPTK